MSFVHLHNHTQYSLLDGACRVDKMIALAKAKQMPAVAMTDHGNMFGAIDFYKTAKKYKIKPIIGIETYLINGELEDPEAKKNRRYHLILLAQNKTGYRNLIKLSTNAYLKGFYYKPRISKTLLRKYSEGLICLSACIKGELPSLILKGDYEAVNKTLEFYRETFPDRFYLELQDHGLDEEKIIAPELIKLAERTDTPLVVTNDCHYLEKADSEAHDVLLCIQTGKKLTDSDRMQYKTDQLYFKSEEEMRQLFPDQPAAYENTLKIASEIDLELDYNSFLLPNFEIPAEFSDKTDFLKILCDQAAREKYPEMTDEIRNRMEFELETIKKMGYEGYFLIVKDFIDAARDMDIPVGPGRGSAVGSIVSYLLGITRVEPLRYGLFFERFLNPDRIGMPDIDIDFCAEGRSRIIDYVIAKYGRKSVAQIITFNTLGAKSVIKDVARVLDLPAARANEITKEIPGSPKITLDQALAQSRDFAALMKENETNAQILTYSRVLEGLIRQIGIHAAGVVIGPGNLSDYVPLAMSTQKNSDNSVLVQYEGKWLDDLKILKMDFLGLKTLTLIRRTIDLVKTGKNLEIDIENLDLSDKLTYELLARGQTDGIFQFESKGMKKYLCDLEPNVFEDLIAMVALYRPGPMQFIETFISRKHGHKKIKYEHPLTENILKETYGVTVYQEQVMQIAREMGGLTGAEADTLRKAISKKKLATMEKMKNKFVTGALSKGVNQSTIEKIWNNWLEFANYAFNKSHATAYALIAFQTAYLKAHYPVEFMAALLSLEDNPTKIPYFINECRNMGIEVEPPNINKSEKDFQVRGNKILFGLRAIKNVGDAAINSILEDRTKNGEINNIFDFCSRSDSSCVNKAVVESLIAAGAMDDLEGSRAQKYDAVETALEFASSVQNELRRGQIMLFDTFQEEVQSDYFPELPHLHEWSFREKLRREREILGFYWSGHPLHKFEQLLDFLNCSSSDQTAQNGTDITNNLAIGGVVAEITKKTDKKGNPYAIIMLEDLKGKFELCLFSNHYETFSSQMEYGKELLILGKRSNFNNDNENMLRLVPNKIIALPELNLHLSGNIYLKIRESKANKQLAEQLNRYCRQSPGKFGIHFLVQTKKFRNLELHPKKLKLFPDDNIREFLDDLAVEKPIIKLDFD